MQFYKHLHKHFAIVSDTMVIIDNAEQQMAFGPLKGDNAKRLLELLRIMGSSISRQEFEAEMPEHGIQNALSRYMYETCVAEEEKQQAVLN